MFQGKIKHAKFQITVPCSQSRLSLIEVVVRGLTLKYSAGLVIGPPAHRANPVMGPSKGLHHFSAITRELRETIVGFKRQEYGFGNTNVNEFIF